MQKDENFEKGQLRRFLASFEQLGQLKHFAFITAFLIFNLSTASEAQSSLPSGIFSLEGINPDLPFSDLTPLGDTISGGDVIGLGEAKHTSGGFHQMKARIIRYLIEEMGFRAIAFETPWHAVMDTTADYVAGGSGTATEAVTGLFPVFQSMEIVKLIDWIRQYNLAHSDDPVSVFGFDIQQAESDVRDIRAFIHRHIPELGGSLNPGFDSCIVPNPGSNPGPSTQVDYDTCIRTIQLCRNYMMDHAAELIAVSANKKSFDYVMTSLTGIEANANMTFYRNVGDGDLGRTYRDLGMGEVFQKLRHTIAGDARTVVWAHNGHITMRGERMRFPFANKTLGSVLKDAYGDRYRSLGCIAYDVEVAPWWTFEGSSQVPALDSVEAILNGLQKPLLFVRFPNALLAPDRMYWVSPSYGLPQEQYSGLVFLQRSPAMTDIQSRID